MKHASIPHQQFSGPSHNNVAAKIVNRQSYTYVNNNQYPLKMKNDNKSFFGYEVYAYREFFRFHNHTLDSFNRLFLFITIECHKTEEKKNTKIAYSKYLLHYL